MWAVEHLGVGHLRLVPGYGVDSHINVYYLVRGDDYDVDCRFGG